ncbi:MAG TPA: histidine ammonia-lyase [Ignavibacteriaceae bacterium]|nr:histidine ammonia-lyase [Ignavibacteriaceae bacterium]
MAVKRNHFIRPSLFIDGNSLTLEKIESFLKTNPTVEITPEAKKRINSSRELVEKWVMAEESIYGVTTGVGEFANIKVSKKDIRKLQENLILSHSAGCGANLPPFIVKIMMLLRLNALAKGYSGIRHSTLRLLAEMIENNIIPVIPSQGSVGSSGDLVQLSHLVLAMIGRGKVQLIKNIIDPDAGCEKEIKAEEGLRKFKLKPVTLEAKEGLALINGTQMITAYAAYICHLANKLIKIADMSAALSHEALRATDKAFDKKIHLLKPFPGQLTTAENILKLIANSEIRRSHLDNDTRVQDAYSIRCVPQIHGASRDAIEYVCSRVEIEMNSVNDNPIIFPETGEHIEGGNFHGQSMALAMDFMCIALSELANVSERRIERMVNGSLSGLPRFLALKGGLNSGLMIAQYTAASLVSENKVLSHPASVDSIPTSANQEDHNSMGSIAAQKCFRILENLQNVLAIELFTAGQAVEFLKPLKCGDGTSIIYNTIREVVPPLIQDRVIYNDIKNVLKIIKNDYLLNSVESRIPLK